MLDQGVNQAIRKGKIVGIRVGGVGGKIGEDMMNIHPTTGVAAHTDIVETGIGDARLLQVVQIVHKSAVVGRLAHAVYRLNRADDTMKIDGNLHVAAPFIVIFRGRGHSPVLEIDGFFHATATARSAGARPSRAGTDRWYLACPTVFYVGRFRRLTAACRSFDSGSLCFHHVGDKHVAIVGVGGAEEEAVHRLAGFSAPHVVEHQLAVAEAVQSQVVERQIQIALAVAEVKETDGEAAVLQQLGPNKAVVQVVVLRLHAAAYGEGLAISAILIDGNEAQNEFGDLDFTDGGIEGPIGFKVSRKCVNAIINGSKVTAVIDLKPAVEIEELNSRITTLWNEIAKDKRSANKQYKERFRILLTKVLPMSLITAFTRLNPNADHKTLGKSLKSWKMEIVGYVGYERCVVTAGGVSLDEITPKTLESKIAPGLYLAGEVLDLDADTGGYNLQTAFSTGYLAGISAAKSL